MTIQTFSFALFPFLALLQPTLSGRGFCNVRHAAAMDRSITTIEDYKQYLLSIQKIYLKQSFLLPISDYIQNPHQGFGLRGAFDAGKVFMILTDDNPSIPRPARDGNACRMSTRADHCANHAGESDRHLIHLPNLHQVILSEGR